MLQSRKVPKISKIKIYKTVIKPCVIYAAELWTLTKKDENILEIWERKFLLRTFGPKYTNNERKPRTKEEIINIYNASDIGSTIKSKRTEWLGHMQNGKGRKC
jgi:hypothetical protein